MLITGLENCLREKKVKKSLLFSQLKEIEIRFEDIIKYSTRVYCNLCFRFPSLKL